MIVLAGVGAILAVAVLIFLLPPGQITDDVAVGRVDEVEARQVVYIEQHRLYVVATGDGFTALADDSRHVGDRVLYCKTSGTFSSPAHGEFFDPQGRYLGGPASGDLGRYPVIVRDGQIFVKLDGLQLPSRSSTPYQPTGPLCGGPEDPPGFYSDGLA